MSFYVKRRISNHFQSRPRTNRQRCFAPLNMTVLVTGFSPAVFGPLTEPALPVRLFLLGHPIFLKARGVRVGQIRSILIRLIEHFSPATRISAVFLDQRRD
jgi:hypothetical protein